MINRNQILEHSFSVQVCIHARLPVASKNVHESGLAGPRGAHDSDELPTAEFSRQTLQKGLKSCTQHFGYIVFIRVSATSCQIKCMTELASNSYRLDKTLQHNNIHTSYFDGTPIKYFVLKIL